MSVKTRLYFSVFLSLKISTEQYTISSVLDEPNNLKQYCPAAVNQLGSQDVQKYSRFNKSGAQLYIQVLVVINILELSDESEILDTRYRFST